MADNQPLDEKFLEEFPSGTSDMKAAVLYANTYAVGMASLGFQTVLRKLIEHGGFDIRRFFFNPEANGKGVTVAPDGGSLRESDIILASIAYELDYINFVRLLMENGIQPLREDRRGLPLIIAGGIAPSANPLPLADFLDAVFIGECEDVIDEYLEPVVEMAKALRGPGFTEARGEVARLWAENESVFIPGLYEKGILEFNEYEDFEDDPGRSIIISPDSVWGDTFLIEASRGCDKKCSFCLVGYKKPVCRNADYDVLTELIDAVGDNASGVGIIGSSVGTYPELAELIEHCIGKGKRVGLSSLNFRNADDHLLSLLLKSGERSVTLAVETGSQRLQMEIGKMIPEKLVIDRVRAAYDSGFKSVKLYFMIGIPGETDQDLVETIELIQKIIDGTKMRKRKPPVELDIGISFFVPKMGTPWEEMPMEKPQVLKGRLEEIVRSTEGIPGVTVTSESGELAVFQGILSIANESVSWAILYAAKAGKEWRGIFRERCTSDGFFEIIYSQRGE